MHAIIEFGCCTWGLTQEDMSIRRISCRLLDQHTRIRSYSLRLLGLRARYHEECLVCLARSSLES